MAENKISYIARNYDDYKNEIKELTRKYYPDVFASLNDASIGEWLIELVSDVGDNLSFHTDRVFQETDIDSASQMSSLLALARANGLKIPGQKAAVVEVELSCTIPVNDSGSANGDGRQSTADDNYCPYIRRGSLFSTGSVAFELTEDTDFREQFNSEGLSNRQIIPNRDTNGNIQNYTYKKLAIAVAAQSKIYKMTLQPSDIEPFMSITLSDKNVLGVESIIVKEGENISADPITAEFYVDEERYYDLSGNPVQRYFEVDNLIEQYRYGYEVEKAKSTNDDKPSDKPHMYSASGNGISPSDSGDIITYKDYYDPVWETIEVAELGNESKPVQMRQAARGKWKRLKNKFVTEYTNNNRLKIIFGAGIRNKYGEIPSNASLFTQHMMSRMYANDYMGALPESGTTLYVLYKVGGGEISNIAENTLTNIVSLDYNIDGCDADSKSAFKRRAVKDSIRVTNPSVSYGGKDTPNAEEIRQMIKYNNCAQSRCVTLNDYYARLNQMPGKYGLPFRVGIIEENNKVAIYSLGLDSKGKLTSVLSETVAENMKEYLSMYKMINDFIEIKSGKIINMAFTITVYIDKAYDRAEVVQRIINRVYSYMDIRRHQMGEDIYLGDLQKEITKLDGVVQFVSMLCENKCGEGYSVDATTQETIDSSDPCYERLGIARDNGTNYIDLDASDFILFSEANSMHEIKYKEKDITVITKVR